MMSIDLSAIQHSLIDDTVKGMPGGIAAFALRDIGKKNWNVLREDLALPLVVLKQAALAHNAEWMRRFTSMTGTHLCPHGKTTMSPQLFDLQLRNDAWGITAATVSQVQVLRRYGVRRVLLANQLVGRQSIRYVLGEQHRDPAFDFYCLVDSVAGVELLRATARAFETRRPLQVLLEIGQSGGRTGVRGLEQAIEVARAVSAANPHLHLRGVEGYEGILPGSNREDMQKRIERLLHDMKEAAHAFAREDLFAPGPVILSAGGSAYFDLPAWVLRDAGIARETLVVLRSGCYVTHDSSWLEQLHSQINERRPELAQLGEGLKPALEVWAYVQSIPESSVLIATMGKRDCSYDVELPTLTGWFRPGHHLKPEPIEPGRYIVTKLNDQHAYLHRPEGCALRVGDMLRFGISHPCTTFDKWSLIPVVNDAYDVVDAVRTFF